MNKTIVKKVFEKRIKIMNAKVRVLRFGHRKKRDIRVTSHCALVARAFGVEKIIINGEKDETPVKTLENVNARFGGNTAIEFANWKKTLKEHKRKGWKIVHLTMYGEKLLERIKKIRKEKKILVFIGAEKVPGKIYKIADWNISVGNQPHSEVAALAIFLHELWKGKELEKNFKKAKIKIIPQEKGKKVIKIN